MGQPYVSTKFRTGAEFEAWLEEVLKTDEALRKSITDIVNGDTIVGKADKAQHAEGTNYATLAESAYKATNDGNGVNIDEAYAKKNGTYENMTVGKANSADYATKATQDGNGNNIADTYATNAKLEEAKDIAQVAQGGENFIPSSTTYEMRIGTSESARIMTVFTKDDSGVASTSTIYVPPISYIKANNLTTIYGTGQVCTQLYQAQLVSKTPIVTVVYAGGVLDLKLTEETRGTHKICAVYSYDIPSGNLR